MAQFTPQALGRLLGQVERRVLVDAITESGLADADVLFGQVQLLEAIRKIVVREGEQTIWEFLAEIIADFPIPFASALAALFLIIAEWMAAEEGTTIVVQAPDPVSNLTKEDFAYLYPRAQHVYFAILQARNDTASGWRTINSVLASPLAWDHEVNQRRLIEARNRLIGAESTLNRAAGPALEIEYHLGSIDHA